MPIKSEEGKIAWYDLFKFLVPIVEKIIAKMRERYVFIPLWYSQIRRYIYHIHTDDSTRDRVYDYLGEDILKKFGFVFGNTRRIGENIFDLGIYAFLPFFEIAHRYGNKFIGRRKASTVCDDFIEGITSDEYEGVANAVEDASLLLKFVLKECCDENFPLLLTNKKGDFARFYKVVSETKATKRKKQILNRFLRASLRGMYISSEGFSVIGFSTKPSEIKRDAGRIAGMIGKKAFETVKKIRKLEVEGKLIAVFESDEKKEAVKRVFGGLPAVNVLITDPARFLKLRYLFDAFIGEMEKFDRDITTTFWEKMETHYRVPVILNIFKDKAGNPRSVCSAYNIKKGLKTRKRIQQIKYPTEKIEYGKAEDRLMDIVHNYHIFNPKKLPSED